MLVNPRSSRKDYIEEVLSETVKTELASESYHIVTANGNKLINYKSIQPERIFYNRTPESNNAADITQITNLSHSFTKITREFEPYSHINKDDT